MMVGYAQSVTVKPSHFTMFPSCRLRPALPLQVQVLATRTDIPRPSPSVFYFNTWSLLPKVDEVRAICANNHYDLVTVESCLSAGVLDSEIHIPGYGLVRKDRNLLEGELPYAL